MFSGFAHSLLLIGCPSKDVNYGVDRFFFDSLDWSRITDSLAYRHYPLCQSFKFGITLLDSINMGTNSPVSGL